MTDSNLAIVDLDQFPEGWIETKRGKKRTQIGVGDVAASFAGFYGGSWRFNLLSKKIELDGIPVPPRDRASVFQLSLKGWTVSKKKAIDGARAAAYANSFNPVQEYLERIANDDSITPADLNTIATTYFDTKDPLYDAMVRATLIGAVRRTFEPWLHVRTVLVFKGGPRTSASRQSFGTLPVLTGFLTPAKTTTRTSCSLSTVRGSRAGRAGQHHRQEGSGQAEEPDQFAKGQPPAALRQNH